MLQYPSEFRKIGRQAGSSRFKDVILWVGGGPENGDGKKPSSFLFTLHLCLSSPTLPHLLTDPRITSGSPSLSCFLLISGLLFPSKRTFWSLARPLWPTLALDKVHNLVSVATGATDAKLLIFYTCQHHEPFLSPRGRNCDGLFPLQPFCPYYLDNKLAKYSLKGGIWCSFSSHIWVRWMAKILYQSIKRRNTKFSYVKTKPKLFISE